MRPELLHQSLGWHELVRVQQQDRKQRAVLRPRQAQRRPVSEHLEGSEDPELHSRRRYLLSAPTVGALARLKRAFAGPGKARSHERMPISGVR
jgi:hypothetical protein